jgi:tetratricopeptide (TPR) repeat protein
MPFGCFLILVNGNAEIEREATWFADDAPKITLGRNEMLKLRMAHSDKSVALTPLVDYQIFSYKKEYKEKKVIYQLIGGIFLPKDENSTTFKDPIQSYTEALFDKRLLPNDELVPLISDTYHRYFRQQQAALDRSVVERNLDERVKMLTLKGKFDEANALLEKMKRIPPKLFASYEAGEKALKIKDYERAQKEYETAVNFAKELDEKDLERQLSQKANLCKRIPSLLKKREELIEKALIAMRNDKFEDAAKNFSSAAEASKELLDSRKTEEYMAKAKALFDYVAVDKKYR